MNKEKQKKPSQLHKNLDYGVKWEQRCQISVYITRMSMNRVRGDEEEDSEKRMK